MFLFPVIIVPAISWSSMLPSAVSHPCCWAAVLWWARCHCTPVQCTPLLRLASQACELHAHISYLSSALNLILFHFHQLLFCAFEFQSTGSNLSYEIRITHFPFGIWLLERLQFLWHRIQRRCCLFEFYFHRGSFVHQLQEFMIITCSKRENIVTIARQFWFLYDIWERWYKVRSIYIEVQSIVTYLMGSIFRSYGHLLFKFIQIVIHSCFITFEGARRFCLKCFLWLVIKVSEL